MSEEWKCPICGPALVMHDASGSFCIRHGNQNDIDADPDCEKWHSAAAKCDEPPSS